MRYLFSVLFSFFFFIASFARCGAYGITAYPSTDNIPMNSLFILSGFAASQDIIDSLNIKYTVYLKSDHGKINLNVVELNDGMHFLKQAVLKPASTLEPNTSYELIIDSLPKYHFIDKTGQPNRDDKSVSWTTTSINDNNAPVFIKAPTFKKFHYQQLGCGPNFHAIYKLKIDDLENSLVKVELRDIVRRDTVLHKHYLLPEN